ncbi:MAG: PEGA domain-containing protein [Deltaproteobacteria bacterium]|nr:MAG: PEGA domain-containing protein [Deltaproteobacteria bacterium]
MRWALACAAALAVASAAGPAVAAPRAGIVVRAAARPPVPARAAAEAVRAAASAAGADARVDPAPIPGAVPRERLRPFGRARALADEGWRAYKRVEPEFAEARLAEARRVALDVLALDGGAELMAEISLRLAAVRLYRGRAREADDDFRFAHALAPDRPVTTAEFRPQVVDAFARAIAQSPAEVTVSVSAPAGAAIEVDGRPVGAAPAAVRVRVGRHAFVARKPGALPAARVVSVTAEGGAVELALERDPLAAAAVAPLDVGVDEVRAAQRVEARIVEADLDLLVLAAPVWRGGAPALVGQRCEGTPVACGPVVEIRFADAAGLAGAARALWVALVERRDLRFPPTLLADARVARGEPPPGDRTARPARRWWQSRWLWAGVGAIAIGAVTAAVVTGGDDARAIVDVAPCDFGACEP